MAQPDTSEHYALGHIEEATPGREASMQATVEISREDYERYSTATNNVERLARTPFILKHLHQNFTSLEATFDHLATVLSLGRALGTPDRRDLLEALAGQIVNWLTAMRLYLDHTAALLDRRYGKNSAELLEFKAATNAAFDESSAYRFIYKFRNYVQHRGLPLSRLTMTAEIEGKLPVVDFLLTRDHLLQDYDGWGSPVTRDLKAGPTEFLLRPLIKETMEHLSAFHLIVMRLDATMAASTVGTLEEAAGRFPEQAGTPTLFMFRERPDGEKIDINLQPLQLLAIPALRSVADGLADPMSMVRPVAPPSSNLDPETLREQLHPNSRGVQAISAWLAEDPPGRVFADAMNGIISEDGDPGDLIMGLVNVAALLLYLTGLSIGADPKGLLSSLYIDYAAKLDGTDPDQSRANDATD